MSLFCVQRKEIRAWAADAFKRLTAINDKAFWKIKEYIDITDSEVDIEAAQWLHIVEQHGDDKEFIFSNLKNTVKMKKTKIQYFL